MKNSLKLGFLVLVVAISAAACGGGDKPKVVDSVVKVDSVIKKDSTVKIDSTAKTDTTKKDTTKK